MCEGGINAAQMRLAVAMVNDTLALSQQHLEQLHQLADQGRRPAMSADLAQVTVMLGAARDKLDAAIGSLAAADDVTVERL